MSTVAVANARVLVVEDEALIAEEIQDRLRRLSFDVVGIEDTGEGALRATSLTRPDLVLMDIRLKGAMDGIEAAALIRSEFNIPVVFLTAHADHATLERAKHTAPFGYVLKPFQERDLVVTIDMAVHRHALEQRLRASEVRFATTLASIGDGVIAADATGSVTFMNPVCAALTGWSATQASGRPLPEVIELVDEQTGRPIEHPATLALRGRAVLRFGPVMLLAHNVPVLVEGCAAPVVDHTGLLTGVVVALRDIGERRNAEEAVRFAEAELRQAQKVEAIGHLAGGIAHDFNNLLTVINGYSEAVLERELDATSGIYLRHIHNAGTRAALLTRQLLAFARKQVLEPRWLDLNAAIGQIERILQRLIGEDVILEYQLHPEAGQVHADPTQIEQVILNLAINARDAMPRGGRLTIATMPVELAGTELLSGTYTRLSVTDTGIGMDAATRLRIFEPFFTTKPSGKGTGLGLSTVYGIVRQSGGRVEVTSTLGEGTTFDVLLPSTGLRDAVTVVDDEEAPVASGSETVLIVEDQADVREFAEHSLVRYGYTVLSAESAREALTLCQDHPGHIQLLLTDVVMPNIGGMELAAKIVDWRPLVRVLFVSGYSDDIIEQDAGAKLPAWFLQKPFSSRTLARKVREVLDA